MWESDCIYRSKSLEALCLLCLNKSFERCFILKGPPCGAMFLPEFSQKKKEYSRKQTEKNIISLQQVLSWAFGLSRGVWLVLAIFSIDLLFKFWTQDAKNAAQQWKNNSSMKWRVRYVQQLWLYLSLVGPFYPIILLTNVYTLFVAAFYVVVLL